MRSARRGWPAVAATVALLVTGCAAIPTSGAVQEGAEVQAAAEDPFIRVLPRPPAEGLGPVDVVRGFLTASASFENDHAVARLYLTSDASSRWDATAGVTVYDDDRGPVIRGDASGVQVRTQVSARIDADGLLSPQPDRTVTSDFSLVETDAGWRISELPDGLLLSRADIERSFRPFDLYFLTPKATGSCQTRCSSRSRVPARRRAWCGLCWTGRPPGWHRRCATPSRQGRPPWSTRFPWRTESPLSTCPPRRCSPTTPTANGWPRSWCGP
jgi:hypothetical protein